MSEQRYNFVYCLHCRYDVEDAEGYLEAKNWVYCPYCGSKLVNMPRTVIDSAYTNRLQERIKKMCAMIEKNCD